MRGEDAVSKLESAVRETVRSSGGMAVKELVHSLTKGEVEEWQAFDAVERMLGRGELHLDSNLQLCLTEGPSTRRVAG